MITINFQESYGVLDIQEPNFKVPNTEVVYIFYTQQSELSKTEILKRFKNLLHTSDIRFLRPLKNISGDWLIDLKEMRHYFSSLKEVEFLNHKYTFEPEVIYDSYITEDEEKIINKTILKLSFYKEDILKNTIKSNISESIPDDIKLSSQKFFKDFEPNQKTAFLMMKFEDSNTQINIVNIIKEIFDSHGIKVLRADDKWYSDDLFHNIKTYLHCCDFGIGLFERVKSEYFNPNVSLEIGYMIGQNKDVLLLKDDTLNSLQTDLVSKLYYTFDSQNPRKQLETSIKRWLIDKEIIK